MTLFIVSLLSINVIAGGGDENRTHHQGDPSDIPGKQSSTGPTNRNVDPKQNCVPHGDDKPQDFRKRACED